MIFLAQNLFILHYFCWFITYSSLNLKCHSILVYMTNYIIRVIMAIIILWYYHVLCIYMYVYHIKNQADNLFIIIHKTKKTLLNSLVYWMKILLWASIYSLSFIWKYNKICWILPKSILGMKNCFSLKKKVKKSTAVEGFQNSIIWVNKNDLLWFLCYIVYYASNEYIVFLKGQFHEQVDKSVL